MTFVLVCLQVPSQNLPFKRLQLINRSPMRCGINKTVPGKIFPVKVYRLKMCCLVDTTLNRASPCSMLRRRFFGNSSCSYCQANKCEEDHDFNPSVKIRNEQFHYVIGPK